MAIDPDEIEVAQQAVQRLIDDNVPRWAKMMMPADVALRVAMAVLEALDKRNSAKQP